jgi:hypothetical protein
MTLKELFGCLVLCACGVMSSVLAGRHFGFLGYVIGFPAGFLGTALALFGVGWLYLYLDQAGPRVPACHTGRCRVPRGVLNDDWGEYEMAGRDEHGNRIIRCGCGREYVITDGGRRFMERLADGTLKPYMRHRPFRGWCPDSTGDA